MADNVERGFENWKVSGLLARDVPVCDQANSLVFLLCTLVYLGGRVGSYSRLRAYMF